MARPAHPVPPAAAGSPPVLGPGRLPWHRCLDPGVGALPTVEDFSALSALLDVLMDDIIILIYFGLKID
jgi:hypothetical protein